jgi:serine/threonine protein kinase
MPVSLRLILLLRRQHLMADREGQQLGNYRLTRLLGKGGFAEVYLGTHLYLGTEAAIKLLHTQLAGETDIEKFRREASTIARLVHPNIVRVLDFGVSEGTPYLVMDYAPNGSLRQVLPANTPLAPQNILPYVRQMADALQHAHEQRLVHRDVKPENMLLGRSNEALLSDFGIATASQTSSQQSTQAVAGTAAYMAPEQLQGHPRPASDQYSLAVVVYEWLAGERPFHGSFTEIASQHVLRPPPPLRQRVPTLSPAIEQVVLTALAKDPKERFPDVRAFAAAFEQASRAVDSVYSSYTQPPPSAPRTPPADQWSRSGGPSVLDAETRVRQAGAPLPSDMRTPPTMQPPGGQFRSPATPSGGPGGSLRSMEGAPGGPQRSMDYGPGGSQRSMDRGPGSQRSGAWDGSGRGAPPGAPGGWGAAPADAGPDDWDAPTSATGYGQQRGGAARYDGWGGPPAGPPPGGTFESRSFGGPPSRPGRNVPVVPPPGGQSNKTRVTLIALVAALLVIVLVSGSLAAYGVSTGGGPMGFLHSGSAPTTTTAHGGPNTQPTGTTAPGVSSTATSPTAPTATATTAPTATNTPFTPHYAMNIQANSVNVAKGSSNSVTASCQGNDQLVSGGYYIQDTNQLYNGESSYPSSSNSWTASASNNTSQTMTLWAYADCLHANFSVGIQIVNNVVSVPVQMTRTAIVACPSGSVVTGGGFKTTPANAGWVIATNPGTTPVGWGIASQAAFSGITQVVYALCATKNLALASTPSANFTVSASSAGQNSLACGAGQLLTGGGYSDIDSGAFGNNLYYLDGPSSDFSHWFAEVYNRDSTSSHTASVWADCVTVTA